MTLQITGRRRRSSSSSLPLQQLRLFFFVLGIVISAFVVVVSSAENAHNIIPLTSSKTTLEIAFTQAFNKAIENGDWNDIFGVDDNDIRKDSFCTGNGNPEEQWILPKAIDENSDLEVVVKRGTFKCGTVRDAHFTTSSGKVLLQTVDNTTTITNGTTTTTTPTTQTTGSIVDWWDVLAEYVGETMGTDIQIEWIPYESSQAALEALENGQIDAGCGYWAPDGIYMKTTTDPDLDSNLENGSSTGQTNKATAIARGAAFSMQWCPTFLQVNYLYTDAVNGAIENFNELIAFMNFDGIDTSPDTVTAASAAVTTPSTTFTICVNALPDAGLVTSCQNMFNSYTLSANVVQCKGVGDNDAFAKVLNGECIAAYSGGGHGHPDEDEDSFYKFSQPTLFPAVSFFRQNDIMNNNVEEKSNINNNKPTSLQMAVTRAFNDLIGSGTYTKMFGELADRDPLSFCSGNSNNGVWPIPQSIDEDEDSDLTAIMNKQVFRCGFGKDSYLTAPSNDRDNPNEVVLIDTRGDGDANPTGIFVDYWKLLLNKVGSYYDKEDGYLDVEWIEYESGQEVLDALHDGNIDSACAYFSPDLTWQITTGGGGSNSDNDEDDESTTRIARGLGFSKLYCPLYAEKVYIYTLDFFDYTIESFDDLLTLVNNGDITTVCAVGGNAGSSCAKTFTLYAETAVRCALKGSEEAFALLATGECPAVFAGSTHDVGNSFIRFEQPFHPTPVSLFRNFDIGQQTTSSSPPPPFMRGGGVAATTAIPALSWLLYSLLH